MAKTTKRVGRPRKATTTTPSVKRHVTKTIAFNSMDDMSDNVSTVLKSLITQDGRFTTTEAKAISMLYGNQLAYLKVKLDVHKISNQHTALSTEVKDVLKLS